MELAAAGPAALLAQRQPGPGAGQHAVPARGVRQRHGQALPASQGRVGGLGGDRHPQVHLYSILYHPTQYFIL